MVNSKKGFRSGGGRDNGEGPKRRGRGGYGKRVEDNSSTKTSPFPSSSKVALRPQGFSLQAEALNTQRHDPSRLSDIRLRDTKVNFVSASSLLTPSTKDSGASMEYICFEKSKSDHEIRKTTDLPRDAENIDEAGSVEEDHRSTGEEMQNNFIIDIEGSHSIKTGLPPPQIRPSSPSPSSSSEEIILFGGRDSNGKCIERLSSTSSRCLNTSTPRTTIEDDVAVSSQDTQSSAYSSVAENKLHLSTNVNQVRRLPSARSMFSVDSDLQSGLVDSPVSITMTTQTQLNTGRSRPIKSIENEMMDDYIANVEKHGLNVLEPGNDRELGGYEYDTWQNRNSSMGSDQKSLDVNSCQSDITDLDILRTASEDSDDEITVLSKRDKKSVLEYPVNMSNCTSVNSRLTPEATFSTPDLIRRTEVDNKLVRDSLNGDIDDAGSDDNLAPTYESGDSEDDDIDLVQREIDSVDEKTARLWAKQPEYEFNFAELALFDGSNEATNRNTSTASGRRKQQLQRRQKTCEASTSTFPSATILADAYDGFDVMDFERPSLKKKSKGRKGKLPFDVSDPELEASMQFVRENGREKKKRRKEEREQRRAVGLLGNNPNKPDLTMKYKEGMGIQAVKDEIRTFLMGNNTTLALTPMDKKDRILVHEIANAFNLKSKSVGAERKRFPVLYRTQRTSVFDEVIFNSVERRISRRFFPRMDIKGKRPVIKTGSGLDSASVRYRDGDVVGGSAPELGVENRGRAMLEKMGWSNGTALGAINNKGILQPVSHVVKTTKAGLG